jgi:hypothetical protein
MNEIFTVYRLDAGEDKPKPAQAQANKARTAKFKPTKRGKSFSPAHLRNLVKGSVVTVMHDTDRPDSVLGESNQRPVALKCFWEAGDGRETERRPQTMGIGDLATVGGPGVTKYKPKPAQAQAITARPAKFQLRFVGQAVSASRSEKSGRKKDNSHGRGWERC